MRAIDRRSVLRGAGAVLALPLLDAMGARASTAPSAPPPRRLVFVYAPNGVHRALWTPAAAGPLESLPPTLEPLAAWRERMLSIGGLALDGARAHGDGPGDHARANAAFLTCAHPRKTDGAELEAGISVDQLAAQRIGARTRLRSLEIGCEGGSQSGQCDSGYACAYSSNLSWASPRTPCPKETDPRRVFDRLFRDGADGESDEERAARLARRRSVLDLVREEARALSRRLGAADRRKLDEYESAVRELERRLERAAQGDDEVPDAARPAGTPKDRGEHAALLADVLALAFRTDSTRIATFSLANEGSNASHRAIGVPEGHHEISHHGGDAAKMAKVGLVDAFHMRCLAQVLAKLEAAGEGDGTLLDRTDVLFGSGIGDGNRHDHADLPILLFAGGVRGGRHVIAPRETPLANLHLALLGRMGVDAPRFGDSTGCFELG